MHTVNPGVKCQLSPEQRCAAVRDNSFKSLRVLPIIAPAQRQSEPQKCLDSWWVCFWCPTQSSTEPIKHIHVCFWHDEKDPYRVCLHEWRLWRRQVTPFKDIWYGATLNEWAGLMLQSHVCVHASGVKNPAPLDSCRLTLRVYSLVCSFIFFGSWFCWRCTAGSAKQNTDGNNRCYLSWRKGN